MNMALWVEEDVLRNEVGNFCHPRSLPLLIYGQVIMDPIEALVVPATNIIFTPGLHTTRKIHNLCQGQHPAAYEDMINNGKVADALLHVLLSDPVHAARKETIVEWMVRLSLLVPVRDPETKSSQTLICPGFPCFIAPALLKGG